MKLERSSFNLSSSYMYSAAWKPSGMSWHEYLNSTVNLFHLRVAVLLIWFASAKVGMFLLEELNLFVIKPKIFAVLFKIRRSAVITGDRESSPGELYSSMALPLCRVTISHLKIFRSGLAFHKTRVKHYKIHHGRRNCPFSFKKKTLSCRSCWGESACSIHIIILEGSPRDLTLSISMTNSEHLISDWYF